MPGESMDARFARLDEKMDHLIRTHEESNRDHRFDRDELNKQMKLLDVRVGNIEKTIQVANISWKTLLIAGSVLSTIIGAAYAVIHFFGFTITIK